MLEETYTNCYHMDCILDDKHGHPIQPLLPLTELTSIIYQEQTEIGWKQIYYGWFSKEWTHFASNNYPKIDATNLYAKILQIIWEHILALWMSRNHNNAQTIKWFPPNMVSEINGIYASRDRLPPHTQQIIFKLSKEELLTKSKQYIQSWINHSKTFIRNELRIIAKQQCSNTQDICQFFPPR